MRPHFLFTRTLVLGLCAIPAAAATQTCPLDAKASGSACSSSSQAGATATCQASGSTATAAAMPGQGGDGQCGGGSGGAKASVGQAACTATGTAAAGATCQGAGEGAATIVLSPAGTCCQGAGKETALFHTRAALGAGGGGGSATVQSDPFAVHVGADGEFFFSAQGTAIAPQGSDRGYMGVTIEVQSDAIAIQSVFPDSPAAQAGLEEGDRILRVGGMDVGSSEDVMAFLSGRKPGETIELLVDRDGWTRELELELAAADPAWNLPGVPGAPAPLARVAPEGSFEMITEDDGVYGLFRSNGEEDAEDGEGQGDGSRRIRVVPADPRQPQVLHFEVDGGDGEWVEDGDSKHMTKTIEIPGGECKVEIRIEGDGAHALHGIDVEKILDDVHVMHLGEGSHECTEECEEECAEGGKQVIVLEDVTEGSEDGQVRRRMTLRPGSGAMVLPRVHVGEIAIPEIAERVQRALGQQGTPRVRTLRSGGESHDDLRAELDALRAEVEELRKLRDELDHIESLRKELRQLLDSLGGGQAR